MQNEEFNQPWMEEMISAPIHTNFFENRSPDYAKGKTLGDWEKTGLKVKTKKL